MFYEWKCVYNVYYHNIIDILHFKVFLTYKKFSGLLKSFNIFKNIIWSENEVNFKTYFIVVGLCENESVLNVQNNIYV